MIDPKEKLLREKDAADVLALSVKTLRGWRVKGTGPGFHKLGAAVRYDRKDLEAFVAAGSRNSTSQ